MKIGTIVFAGQKLQFSDLDEISSCFQAYNRGKVHIGCHAHKIVELHSK